MSLKVLDQVENIKPRNSHGHAAPWIFSKYSWLDHLNHNSSATHAIHIKSSAQGPLTVNLKYVNLPRICKQQFLVHAWSIQIYEHSSYSMLRIKTQSHKCCSLKWLSKFSHETGMYMEMWNPNLVSQQWHNPWFGLFADSS